MKGNLGNFLIIRVKCWYLSGINNYNDNFYYNIRKGLLTVGGLFLSLFLLLLYYVGVNFLKINCCDNKIVNQKRFYDEFDLNESSKKKLELFEILFKAFFDKKLICYQGFVKDYVIITGYVRDLNRNSILNWAYLSKFIKFKDCFLIQDVRCNVHIFPNTMFDSIEDEKASIRWISEFEGNMKIGMLKENFKNYFKSKRKSSLVKRRNWIKYLKNDFFMINKNIDFDEKLFIVNFFIWVMSISPEIDKRFMIRHIFEIISKKLKLEIVICRDIIFLIYNWDEVVYILKNRDFKLLKRLDKDEVLGIVYEWFVEDFNKMKIDNKANYDIFRKDYLL